jgi:hypothetical protein
VKDIIFPNDIQFPVPNAGDTQAEALDRGRKTATTMTRTYYCLCNLSPIVSAIILLINFTSIPISIEIGIGLPGLICAMIFLGVAADGFRTMVGPFIAEQYTRKTLAIKGLDSNIFLVYVSGQFNQSLVSLIGQRMLVHSLQSFSHQLLKNIIHFGLPTSLHYLSVQSVSLYH